jgi:hypothetical protein
MAPADDVRSLPDLRHAGLRGPAQRSGLARSDAIDFLPTRAMPHFFFFRTTRRRLIFALLAQGDKKARLMCVHFSAIFS